MKAHIINLPYSYHTRLSTSRTYPLCLVPPPRTGNQNRQPSLDSNSHAKLAILTILVHFVFVLISYLWVLSRFWGFRVA